MGLKIMDIENSFSLEILLRNRAEKVIKYKRE